MYLNEILKICSSIKDAIMSLLNWLKPPMKHSYMENSDSEEEDKPEEGDNDMTSDMIPGLTSNSIAHDASTISNSKPSCSKQSKASIRYG